MCTCCFLQGTQLDPTKEELWKCLGLLLYQQHKLVLIKIAKDTPPSAVIESITDNTNQNTPSAMSDNGTNINPNINSSVSAGAGAMINTGTNNTNGSEDRAVSPAPNDDDDDQKRQERLIQNYEKSADYFRHAAALNPKEWLYLFRYTQPAHFYVRVCLCLYLYLVRVYACL